MNQEIEQEEIKPLIFNFIFHIVLYIFILVLHLILHSKIFWIFESLEIIFTLGSYLNIISFIFPIFPIIIIAKRKYKKKIMNLIKILTLVLLIIVIILGLIISIVFIVNTINSKVFCKECPFSFTVDHLNATFGQYYDKNTNKNDIKDKCISRKCVLDQVNLDEEYPYVYLCNYEPLEEFKKGDDVIYTRKDQNGEEIITNEQLNCLSVSSKYKKMKFNHSELYLYLDLCYIYADFFRCKRFNKPEKDYNLSSTDECPESNYLLLLYVLCVLVVIMDVIISLLPWIIEYITFKKLVVVLSITRRRVNSHNSTAKSSVISEDQPSFTKEKTPIIIIEPEIQNNDLNINDEDYELELKLKQRKIIINKIELKNIGREDAKDIYKPISFDRIKNSERNKLTTKNNEINNKPKDNNINSAKDKEYHVRNKTIKQQFQNTTLLSSQVKPLVIKIDNNNNNS